MGEENENFTTNEEAQNSVRVVAIAFLVIGLAAAYWIWPTGISDMTLASITFAALLRAIGSAVIALVSFVTTVMFWN